MFKSKMFYGTILAAAFLAFSPAVQAKVYSIPSKDAVATVDVPEKWEPNETDDGIELNSEDATIYMSIDAVKADNVANAVSDKVLLLTKQGLVIDETTKKASDTEQNGLKLHSFHYQGKDDDGPTNFGINLVETGVPNTYLLLAFWANDEALVANEKTLNAITNSVLLTKH